MKIQCSCGTKYAFDVTPEMVQSPIQFVCQACGQDSSAVVNEMIRREFESLQAPATPEPAPIVAAAAVSTEPPPRRTSLRVSVSNPAHTTTAAHAATEPASETAAANPSCARHRGAPPINHCIVCHQPMCQKCMELFGYVCSPLCKAKAQAQRMNIPVFAGQKSLMERQLWRKVGRITGAIGATLALIVGVWTWYAWFGSRPKPIFSLRFPEASLSGDSHLVGKDQLIFIHGGMLARHDIKAKKEMWSRQLIDQKALAEAAAKRHKEWSDSAARANLEPEVNVRVPPLEKLLEDMRLWAEAALDLHVVGSNVWVVQDGKFIRYDWQTGNPAQEVAFDTGYGETRIENGELMTMDIGAAGRTEIRFINLVTGNTRTEQIQRSAVTASAPAPASAGSGRAMQVASANRTASAGMPLGRPGADADKPLDPATVAAQAQRMPLPARAALPAVLSSQLHQERILRELNEVPTAGGARSRTRAREIPQFTFLPSRNGHLEYRVETLEENFVTRKAMKEPPAQSVLSSSTLNITQTAEVANEILNELQRGRGGDTVVEDHSRYQVTVRRPGGETPDWTGQLIGSPAIFPLQTVTVVVGGTTLVVLDKSNKKIWEATLSHRIKESLIDGPAEEGLGPCVERGNTLFVFDEAVLASFDLASGDVRWRVPSIGISQLFFDDKGMLYVNTSSASPEMLKFSRQIDITQPATSLSAKIDPASGKILWASTGATIAYLSGKYIYTYSAHQAEEDLGFSTGLELPSHVNILRLNPKNGQIMWQHTQRRAPLSVHFNGNVIEFVFKKEVQVLKYLSF